MCGADDIEESARRANLRLLIHAESGERWQPEIVGIPVVRPVSLVPTPKCRKIVTQEKVARECLDRNTWPGLELI